MYIAYSYVFVCMCLYRMFRVEPNERKYVARIKSDNRDTSRFIVLNLDEYIGTMFAIFAFWIKI